MRSICLAMLVCALASAADAAQTKREQFEQNAASTVVGTAPKTMPSPTKPSPLRERIIPPTPSTPPAEDDGSAGPPDSVTVPPMLWVKDPIYIHQDTWLKAGVYKFNLINGVVRATPYGGTGRVGVVAVLPNDKPILVVPGSGIASARTDVYIVYDTTLVRLTGHTRVLPNDAGSMQ